MPCECEPDDALVIRRSQPEWNPGWTLYGYGVSVLVRVHRAPCQLADEVLSATAIKVS